jgi:tRNA/rRNA methyltransferase
MALRRLSVVLVRPHSPANLGSAARAAKNFGADLRLVEPAAAPDEESRRLASGAEDVLESADRFSRLTDAVAPFEAVVATSSFRGRGERPFLSLSELSDWLRDLAPAGVAFVFGPERSGLREEELSHASVCLRLPTEERFPTMNISHAVAVVLAIARMREQPEAPPGPDPWASAAEVEGALEHWDRALEAVDFYDTGHRDRSLRDWRRIVAGRPLTRREAAILRGVANRILVTLGNRKPGAGSR